VDNSSTEDYSPSSGSAWKRPRGTITFGQDPGCSVEVHVVNCAEPGPLSPNHGRARESILRQDTVNSGDMDKLGRYMVHLPSGSSVEETQYYFTVTDVVVREAARMQSKRVEVIRSLTLIEPMDVNGPDKNNRNFLKLGTKRWVYDRAKDNTYNIRQVFHFTDCFFFIIWSLESLRVILLDAGGPVEKWNNEKREGNAFHSCLEMNDFIVEVNGQTLPHDMIREMVSKQPLVLKIHRDPPKIPDEEEFEEKAPQRLKNG